ncbi:MAG: DUF1153 domain-containing protein [Alphaproteobacteria bacterium]|nr:DUF1153 domain-containing protein [Alphaproteobacteria bacterium]
MTMNNANAGATQNPEFKARGNVDLSHLPPPDTKRWVISRKAIVVDAVRKGHITLAEVCARYSLSEEEIRSWMKLSERGGSRALRVTRLQDYRRKTTTTGTAQA